MQLALSNMTTKIYKDISQINLLFYDSVKTSWMKIFTDSNYPPGQSSNILGQFIKTSIQITVELISNPHNPSNPTNLRASKL